MLWHFADYESMAQRKVLSFSTIYDAILQRHHARKSSDLSSGKLAANNRCQNRSNNGKMSASRHDKQNVGEKLPLP